jgi:signal transduction histidine kinase
MRISTRLSLTFSTIASIVFVIFGVTVYWFLSNHSKQDFEERLKERVEITEKIFLEKETFNPVELKKINDQFLHTLPEETEEVLEIQLDAIPKYKYNYPKAVRAKLTENEVFKFEDENLQGASRIFKVKGKKYLVIVTAVNLVGLHNLSFLRNILLVLSLIGIPSIFIGSFIITHRALLPISRKIDKANTIGASNLHQRLRVLNPNDELGKMAIAFNKLLDRLEAAFEAQKSFIRNASHEIRNPVTAIMGEAEVIMSKPRTEEEYLKSITTILSEAETLNSTVNNLLQLSKVDAYEGNIQYEIIRFEEFLHKTKESFNFLNPSNKLVLSINDKTGNESYTISGNTNLLKTAIINLFDNACKFSSNSKVDVVLTRCENQLILAIKDEGIGIFEKDMNKIITPFYRGNNAIKFKGSGVGLYLSSKIIDLHGGILEVHSQIEVGTEVHLRLPLLIT